MSEELHHFLLVFDHEQGQLIDVIDFESNSVKALAEYARLEREHLTNADRVEIVLIGSDSLETVMITHANYFGGTVPVSTYFAGI